MRTWFVITAFISQIAWGALEFETKLIEVDAAADAEKVIVDFKFTNNGDKQVIITRFKTNCDCLTVKFSGGTQLANKTKRYDPGESGIVRGVFIIGNERGVVDRTVGIWLDGNASDQPSLELTASINVPKVISMAPRSLKWDVDSKPEPKRIDVVMNHKKAIHITEAKSSSSNFKIRMETIEEGRRYALWVHPVDTGKPGISVIQVVTDSPVKNQKIEQVFAMVQRGE